MTTTTAVAAGRSRVGRPPRISREMIAEAAHRLEPGRLTLKAVAGRLGVSVPALYHYVSGKEDLLRLAAEHAAERVQRPVDRGQHWAVWLLEWATYNRDVFLARRGLLAEFLGGAISPEVIAENLDAILGQLVRQGFTVAEANAAYELVSSCAIGTALGTIREREATRARRSIMAGYRRILRRRPPRELPHLRQLVDDADAGADAGGVRPPFEEVVATALMGVAARRGDDWPSIERALERARSFSSADPWEGQP